MVIKKVDKDVGAVCSSTGEGLLQGGEVVESTRTTRNRSTRLRARHRMRGIRIVEEDKKNGAVNESNGYTRRRKTPRSHRMLAKTFRDN